MAYKKYFYVMAVALGHSLQAQISFVDVVACAVEHQQELINAAIAIALPMQVQQVKHTIIGNMLISAQQKHESVIKKEIMLSLSKELESCPEAGEDAQLADAIKNLNVDVVRQRIAATNVNKKDNNGNTPLMNTLINVNTAFEQHQDVGKAALEIVDTLLAAGADVNIKDKDGNTALMLTMIGPKKLLNLQLGDLGYFVEHATDKLLNAGAEVNVRNNKGETAFHLLGTSKWLFGVTSFDKVADKLFARGADATIKDSNGDTVLMAIAGKGVRSYSDVTLKKFIALSPLNAQNNEGNTVLMLVILNIYKDFEEFILAGHFYNKPALELIDDLIAAGAKVNLQNKDGNTALMLAMIGPKKILEWNQQGDLGYFVEHATDKLLNAGAEVNVRNNKGETALHLLQKSKWLASVQGLFDKVTDKLLARGADATIKDNNGDTVLMAMAKKGVVLYSDVTLKKFIALSPLNAQNNEGNTVLMLVLLDTNKDFEEFSRVSESALKDIDMLLTAGADVNIQNKNGNTALMLAMMVPNKLKSIKDYEYFMEHIADKLVAAGAKVDLKNNKQETALQLAQAIPFSFIRQKIIETLHAKGAQK